MMFGTNPRRPCGDCGKPIGRTVRQAKFCFPCCDKRQRDSQRRHSVRETAAWRAHHEVKLAIHRGELAPVSTLTCVDCGAPAKHYDHRDYSKPLVVEPVCISCNKYRGPALGDIERVVAYRRKRANGQQ